MKDLSTVQRLIDRQGGYIVIGQRLPLQLTPRQARALAAWLLFLAPDAPGEPTFTELRQAIKELT